MFSILRKPTASSAKSSRSTSPDQCDHAFVDELSTWEFVSSSLTDDEDLYSFDADDVIIEELESKAVEKEEVEKGDACESRKFEPVKSDWVSPPTTFPVEVTRHHALYDEDEKEKDDDDDDDDDEDDLYDDGVDDDLVPWELKGRFGKQRIMKMGKRCVPKSNRSNKLPCYYHNKPKSFEEKSRIARTALAR